MFPCIKTTCSGVRSRYECTNMYKCVKKYPNLFLETTIFRSFIGMRDLVRQNGLFPSDESTLFSQYKDLNIFVHLKPIFFDSSSGFLKIKLGKTETEKHLIFDKIYFLRIYHITVFHADKIESFRSSNVSI